MALVGTSGCGKSTTLKMINRLVEPSAGRVLVDGVDTASVNPEKLRLGMGYAIQGAGLFPHRTVAENIATVPKLLGWDKARIGRRVEELLGLLNLDPAVFAGNSRTSCPAASSSAWASPAPSPGSPRCSSWTSPSERSTRSRACASRTSS